MTPGLIVPNQTGGIAVPLEDVDSIEVEDASDSRRGMEKLLEKLVKVLKLDADADEAKVLEAITELADKGSEENEEAKLPEALVKALELDEDADAETAVKAIKTLADKVSKPEPPKGKELLDTGELTELRSDAKAGREAKAELHQGKFDQAFERTLEDKRVDAKDETREEYQALYEKAPDETLKVLERLPKIVNDAARGHGKERGSDEVPAGVDEERYELHEKVLEYQREQKEPDYAKALDAVVKAERVAA